MKKRYFLLFCLISFASFGQTPTNALVITGVYNGQLGALVNTPSGVELYALKDIPDLSIFGLGSANDGGGTDGKEYTFPAVSARNGEYIYVSSETPNFFAFFGFSPNYTDISMDINGDDAIELFENSQVIDLFGDVTYTSGTGGTLVWNYAGGFAYRNSNTGPSATFTSSDWQFNISGLDDVSNSASSSLFPVKTYTNTLAISKQQLLDGFSLYPNPLRGDLLNVQSPSNTVKSINIFDVIGKQVYQRNTTENQINISNLNAGLYFVKVQQDGKIATRKLVVE